MLNVIGKGGYGSVHKGIQKSTNKKVAIKSVKKVDMTEEDMDFHRKEIDVLKMCQHLNIITLLDIFESAEYFFIVLECMEGGDLFDYLQRRDHYVPEAQAKAIFKQVAEGIAYLHSLGIVHRDLKIENIMMSSNDENAQAKIVDFGLSLILGQGQYANAPLGTLECGPPELLLQKNYNHAIDCWSLGVILYRMLCSDLPFEDSDRNRLCQSILRRPVTYPQPHWKNVSSSARDLISKLLCKDPKQRFTI